MSHQKACLVHISASIKLCPGNFQSCTEVYRDSFCFSNSFADTMRGNDPLDEQHLGLSNCITIDLLSLNVTGVMIPFLKIGCCVSAK